jgi:hypothetical protein
MRHTTYSHCFRSERNMQMQRLVYVAAVMLVAIMNSNGSEGNNMAGTAKKDVIVEVPGSVIIQG